MRLRGHHYRTGQPIDIVCANGAIASVEPVTDGRADIEASWLAPCFFDIQINGCGGLSFNSPDLTTEQIRYVVGVCQRHGIGKLLSTLVTNSHQALVHGLKVIRKACEEDRALAEILPGIHLEGPYLSAEDGPRGAHPRQHVRPPDWDEFRTLQDAAGGRIRLVTLAPELPGAIDFIQQLVNNGIVAAIGHTAASAAQIDAAIAAGARLSTHLGNGAHALLPRHINYIWHQLAADELWASLICDGHHLPPAVVKSMIRVKTPSRIILTCDASPLAGLPPGKYRQWDQDFEILPEGKVVVSGTPYLAGSAVFTESCVENTMRFAGLSLHEAIDLAAVRPYELFGMNPAVIEAGQTADLILFEWSEETRLAIKATIIQGDVAFHC